MLLKKMLRTLLKYKAQFISMVIMIALGAGVFIGFNMEWYSLEKNLEYTLGETGFADFRMYSEKGFGKSDLEKILALPGVEDATRYLSVNTLVKDDTDIIALTVNENMNVSGLMVIDGAPYDETSEDGIWLSDQYARKNGVALGDEMTLTYKNYALTGKVLGLVKSGEYLVCLPDKTQLMPDYTSCGFAYISPAAFQKIIPALFRNLIGDRMYYQINVKSSLDKAAFVSGAEEALGKTLLVLSKDETLAYAEAMGEVEEGKTMGAILPVLFLAIAVLTMVTTMHRVTASEKTQIGTLKSLGFRDRRILAHYSCYALLIGAAGAVLGIGLGYALGWFIMNPQGAMATYLDMPTWNLYVPWFGWAALGLMLALLTFLGYMSVRKMLQGTAADALRPYSPKKMKHLALEETRAFKSLGFGTKWNLRDCFRHKSRSLMTLLGVIGCMVLLVGGLGMKDTVDAFVNVFYHQAINYENRLNLDTESVTGEEAAALAQAYEGDWSAQSSVQIGDRGFSLEIYHITQGLVRFPDENMVISAPLGDTGAYVSARIAKEFSLAPGDSLTFSPYDSDRTYTVQVAGVLRSMLESVIMTSAYADSMGIDYTINTVYTNAASVAPSAHILNVQSKQAIIDSFGTFMKLMNETIFLLVAAAVILGIVVLYSLGVMSYTERYREMATLKVVGFKDKKIANLLISQNLWLTVAGILIGLPAGIGVLQYLLTALAAEYEMKMVLGPATYLVSILLTFLVSLAVGLMVARKNRDIDMVAALKTEE